MTYFINCESSGAGAGAGLGWTMTMTSPRGVLVGDQLILGQKFHGVQAGRGSHSFERRGDGVVAEAQALRARLRLVEVRPL